MEVNYWIFLSTWFGALCAKLFALDYPVFKSLRNFLEQILGKRHKRLCLVLDIIISPILGAGLAYLLMEPSNIKSAVIVGLTWTSSITLFCNLYRNKP